MAALGTHLLIELHGCKPAILDDLKLIRSCLMSAAEKLGVTILSDSFHRFKPQGVTGILAIAESHISIHSWPEYSYAAVDIFTCGNSFEPRKAAEYIAHRLKAERIEIEEFKRGFVPAYSV